MTETEEVFYRYLTTGSVVECEMCGSTLDAMSYIEDSDGTFDLSIDWGCYGGGGASGDATEPGVVGFAISLIYDYTAFDLLDRQEIIERLEALRER